MEEKIINVNMIKTDKGCFISDCQTASGYDYNYHQSKISELYFDGSQPKSTYLKNWYLIDNYPSKVERKVPQQRTNIRYVLKNPSMATEALPLEVTSIDEDVYALYEKKYDLTEEKMELVENLKFEILFEVNNFEFPPSVNYDATVRVNWTDKKVKITNANFKHQLFDRMIIPDILIHNYPCEISSVDLYNVVRQYIKDNINTKYAKITSDYDFCFTVKKLIPMYTPKDYTYMNPFARTKKEREKIHKAVSKYREEEIFEMTHADSKYRGYTVIQPISANNEYELKEKIDTYLESLIKYINEPLIECEHCKGLGFVNEIKRINTNQ